MQWPHQFNAHQFNDLQFNDLRRKATFIAAKIVPNTTRRGATPGPKAAARATIHSTIATVKIVQNTTLLLNVWLRENFKAWLKIEAT
jgi:hypothetical protein